MILQSAHNKHKEERHEADGDADDNRNQYREHNHHSVRSGSALLLVRAAGDGAAHRVVRVARAAVRVV